MRPELRPYRYLADGFAIDLPEAPQRTERAEVLSGIPFRIVQYAREGNRHTPGFMVMVSHMDPSAAPEHLTDDQLASLVEVKDGWKNAVLQEQQPVETNGHRGIEFRFHVPGIGRIYHRIYYVRTSLYQVTLGRLGESEAMRIFDSLRFLRRTENR